MENKPAKLLKILHKEYPNAKYYLNFKTPIDLMVATILSAQVRDEAVNTATVELFKKFKTAKDYASTTPSELHKYISKITFANNKAKNIVNACKMLVEQYKGKVPEDVDELIKLPGIGRKTANAIVQNAFGKVVGIPCDTHVIRLSYRLGWTQNKNPDKIEKDLMGLFPKKEWNKLPYLLKEHGRAVCKAPTPKCSECKLSDLCPKRGVTKSA